MGTTIVDPRGLAANVTLDAGKGKLEVLSSGGGSGGNVVITDVNIPSQTTTLGVSFSEPSAVINGKTTVTTPGTSVPLGASTSISKVTIKAESTNTGTMYVGNSSVSSANGLELDAGESVDVSIDDLAKVYIDASVGTDGVTYIGG